MGIDDHGIMLIMGIGDHWIVLIFWIDDQDIRFIMGIADDGNCLSWTSQMGAFVGIADHGNTLSRDPEQHRDPNAGLPNLGILM